MSGNNITIIGEVVSQGRHSFTIAYDYKLKDGITHTDYFEVAGKAKIGDQVHVLGRVTYQTLEENGKRVEKVLIKPQNIEIVG